MIIPRKQINPLFRNDSHTVFYFKFRVKFLHNLREHFTPQERLIMVPDNFRNAFDAFIALGAVFLQP